MGATFFTSDLHFCHNKPFLYEPRGFVDVWEMNEAIVNRWNSVVQPGDDVFVLGDLILNDNENGIKLIKLLKGNLHIICGNHDTDSRRELYNHCWNIEEICDARVFKAGGFRFFLCHYPVLCSNYDDKEKPLARRLISLCGHTHTKDKFLDWDKGYIYHVELDAHNCYPVSVEDIVKDIKEKEGIR